MNQQQHHVIVRNRHGKIIFNRMATIKNVEFDSDSGRMSATLTLAGLDALKIWLIDGQWQGWV